MKRKSGDNLRCGLAKRVRIQIIFVFIIGSLLIFADLITSSGGGIEIENSYGQLYLIRPEAGEDSEMITITAEVIGEEGTYEKKYNVVLNAYEQEDDQEIVTDQDAVEVMSEEEAVVYDLKNIVDSINDDKTVKKVGLPEKLDSGERIKWKVDNKDGGNTIAILVIVFFTAGFIYKNRNAAEKKREQENRENIIRQLPGFINRLVLLLNAGLVLNSAFEQAVEEGGYFENDEDYFYKNMRQIYLSMKTANGSMNDGLRSFARQSGVQELMRVSNIINDNINKGTELIHKLRSEGELLWMGRKKRCEEMGRIAETKLTLPLIMFLIVLVVITIAPALLEL